MKRVLIAVEDETFGALITDYVAQQAWSEGTQFKVVHAVQPPPIYDLPPTYWSTLIENAEQYGRDLVAKVAAKLGAVGKGIVSEGTIVNGYPDEKIVELAREWDADAIIVGSHGRRGLERLVMGSVSAAVLAHAPCTVIVVRSKEVAKKAP